MADEKTKRSPEDRRAKMYDKSAPKTPEKKFTPEPKKDMEGADEGEGGDAGDKAAMAFKEMAKRHEMERRDAHGAHKDNLRKIAQRHETEIKQFMNDKMSGGSQDTDGAASAPSAGAESAAEED